MSDALLRLDHVHKRFGGLRAVRDVSLQVPEGRICALIGPNGSGKTTTFNMISGALVPTSGQIKWRDKDITGLKPHEIASHGISRTFQLTRSFERLSVHENVTIGALRVSNDLHEARDRAAETLRWAGLEDRTDVKAENLPIVDRKRLELARAVAAGPELLLLDEVLAGLRPVEIDAVIESIRELQSRGITLFVVEHIMRVVMRLSEWIFVLDHGQLIAEGSPSEVSNDPAVIRAYLGESGTEAITR